MPRLRLILLLIQLVPFFCFSQRIPEYCPFNPNQPLEITYNVQLNGNTVVLESLSLVPYLPSSINHQEDNSCNPYSLRYSNAANSFQVYAIIRDIDVTYHDSILATLDEHQIHGLKIEIVGDGALMDLSKLDMLKHLQLTNLESIEIRSYSSAPFLVHLSNWPNYATLRNSNTLSSVKIHSGYEDDNLVENLSVFKKLKFLEIPEIVNYQLTGFIDLETILTLDPTYFFSNNLAKLPALKQYNNASLFRAKMVAEKSFFLNNLALSEFHPVVYIDHLIQASGKLNQDGKVIILAKDIHERDTNSSGLRHIILWYPEPDDTIAVGNIVNGAISGVWSYYLPDEIYYDHEKRTGIEFPADGSWSYYFANGQLAIDGNFRGGKKNGQWKFYRPTGELASIKTFKDDLPSGLFLDYDLDPSLFEGAEVRKYFVNGLYKTYSKQSGRPYGIFATYGGSQTGTFYYSNDNGNLVKSRNGKPVKEVLRDSKKYNRLLYKHYLKYLYPDVKKKDIPPFN